MVFGDKNISEKKSLFSIESNVIENVSEFCYLGHTIFNNSDQTFVELRTSSALSKFNQLGKVLRDKEINIASRNKFLEACVRSRLTYATQAWFPNESEISKLEVCWYGCLRRMVRGGFKRKQGLDGEDTFRFFYSNQDLERIVKTPPLRDFIRVSYLKYIAHICRQQNNSLVKINMFSITKCKYFIKLGNSM